MNNSQVHSKRTQCRACNGKSLRRFLSLGPIPLANSFLNSPEEFTQEVAYPLDVYFCEDCALVQLLDVISPQVLFRDYIYMTGTSDTIHQHYQEYAHTIVKLQQLSSENMVVEIASNDGSLLKCFQPYGVKTLGIEPAVNIAEMARKNGVETINRFFDKATALDVLKSHGPARAILANNVLAHVNDVQNFLRGCVELMDDEGVLCVEVPHLRKLVERLEYDTIYHEHLCYFSITTLMRLYAKVGLSIVRVDHMPVHGGSIRIYARKQKIYRRHTDPILGLADLETKDGLDQFSRYTRFAQDVEHNRRSLLKLLAELRQQGKTVVGYGASAKGNTLLNYCGIRDLPYIVDKSNLKIGRYTPGMHIPVLPVETLLERQPDYVLILAWNFASEIIGQQQEYANRGGKFIIPVPQPEIV